jgi:IclR family mhp operon transcriptional activator
MSDTLNDPTFEPVRPIRALLRGLDVLRVLNRRDGLTVTEVADGSKLARTTAYRILESLRVGGYIIRDDIDDRYRPTLQVRTLAEGAEDEGWVRDAAWPVMTRLCQKMLWPVGLYVVDGGAMVLRAATDRMSPLALERYAPGERAVMARHAAGWAMLAYLGDEQRVRLLEVAGGHRNLTLEAELERTRRTGLAVDAQPVAGECTMAAPVLNHANEPIAVVTLRWIRSAMTVENAVANLGPLLTSAAAEIAGGLNGRRESATVHQLQTGSADATRDSRRQA